MKRKVRVVGRVNRNLAIGGTPALQRTGVVEREIRGRKLQALLERFNVPQSFV
jgi:hypothetical protein